MNIQSSDVRIYRFVIFTFFVTFTIIDSDDGLGKRGLAGLLNGKGTAPLWGVVVLVVERDHRSAKERRWVRLVVVRDHLHAGADPSSIGTDKLYWYNAEAALFVCRGAVCSRAEQRLKEHVPAVVVHKVFEEVHTGAKVVQLEPEA